ncbi:MAG: amidohydrolase family protein [Colwellia sp.]|nr:amidohydrolase family protein [Colwellia sp.]
MVNNSPKIDSHQHFWKLSRGDYFWLSPKFKNIYKDFSPEDLSKELRITNINKTILIQATNTEAETLYLLEIAKNTDFVSGVIGWIDMESPKAIQRLLELSENSLFKGIRPMLQDIPDKNWIANPIFHPIFEIMATKSLVFDALVKDIHLDNIQQLAVKFPTLKIVINHCAKPNIVENKIKLWESEMVKLSKCPNVFVKLSGLVTETKEELITDMSLRFYSDFILKKFGASRIIWGSDWPVVNLRCSYSDWVSISIKLLAHLSPKEQHQIWYSNAVETYNI